MSVVASVVLFAIVYCCAQYAPWVASYVPWAAVGVCVLLVGVLVWESFFRRDMAKWGAACVERWNRLPASPPMTERERRAARLAFLNQALHDTNRQLESLRRPSLLWRLFSDQIDEQFRRDKIAQCEAIQTTQVTEINKLHAAR